jgi:hypothetical protein
MSGQLDAEKVDEIIREYESTPDLTLIQVMNLRRELSCQHYWYSQLLGTLASAYRITRAQRKAKFAELVNRLRPTVNSNAAAQALAEVDDEYRTLYENEHKLDGRERAGARICDAIKLVLNGMHQEIAELREEERNIRETQPT